MKYCHDVFNDECPSRQVLDRIADKWTALVICALSGSNVGLREFLDHRRQYVGTDV